MRIFNKIFGILLVFFAIGTNVFAKETEESKTILILSDRIEQANAQYLIYPQVSEMIASEIINELNLSGAVKATSLSSARAKTRTPELIYSTQKVLNTYRYNYELNYEALKKIANAFNTTNVLLVTGGLDTTSDFLKPTWWNFLNIPGENVVKTEYRLYTYVALIDTNDYTIKWQNTYHKQITAPEFALANATYSPDYRQLKKIKKISTSIAKDASYRIESVLTPIFASKKEPPTIHERIKFEANQKKDEYIQNINETKEPTTQEQTLIPVVEKDNLIEEKIKTEKQEIKNINTKLNEKSVKTIDNKTEEKTETEPKEHNIQVSPLNIIIPTM